MTLPPAGVASSALTSKFEMMSLAASSPPSTWVEAHVTLQSIFTPSRSASAWLRMSARLTTASRSQGRSVSRACFA